MSRADPDSSVVSGCEVASSFGVAWGRSAVINIAAAAMANPDSRPVFAPWIDENRYRLMRFLHDPDTAK